MLKTKKKDKYILRTSVRWCCFGLSGLLVAAAAYFAYRTMTPQTQTVESTLYSCHVSADGSYKVVLLANDLYTEAALEEGRLYSSSLIDRLQVVFEAEYVGSNAAQVTGSYTVDAVASGVQNGSLIYERYFPLVPLTTVTGDKNISISRPVPVTLNSYLEFSETAAQILGARPQQELTLLFSGTFVAETDAGSVEAPFFYTMTVPLTSGLFSINKQEAYIHKDSIIKTEVLSVPVNQNQLIPWAICAFLGLLLTVITGVFTRRPTLEEQSRMEMKEMLRKHKSRMIQLSEPRELAVDCVKTPVSTFEDLIKLSDSLQHPIYFCLAPDGLPADGLFYVKDGGHCYDFCYQMPGDYSFSSTCTPPEE